jgi:uncharacterized protein (TIGR02246 family)
MAAKTPEEVHTLFAEFFSAGDLDRLMSLYEDSASFLSRDIGLVRGKEQIREHFATIIADNETMELAVKKVVRADDLALLLSDWTIYQDADSGRIALAHGRTSDVVRRQQDDSWLLVLDNPYGAMAGDWIGSQL